MKRNLLIVVIALLAVAFVSCQKDGVYKPKKKIAKITSTQNIDVGFLASKTETTADIVYEYDGNVPVSAKTTSVAITEIDGMAESKQTTTKVTNEKYEYTK